MKVTKAIKAALAAFLTGVIAVLLFVISATVRTRSRVEPENTTPSKKEDVTDDKFNQKAEAERFEGEDALRSRTPGDVAHEYDGVVRAVDDGRNRFASRAKNRILAAGGRRVDEQHID